MSDVLLTVDVEPDWGHEGTRAVDEILPRFLERLEAAGARATFFVVGDLAERVRRHLDPASPHEVGSHGLTHALLPGLDFASRQAEVEGSRRRLQEAGYRVSGFRAPYLRSTPDLGLLLARAGYRYDASGGSVLPGVPLPQRARWATDPPLPRLATGRLRTGLLPFTLTWLRVTDPAGRALVPEHPRVFLCHLHEFLEGGAGMNGLPGPLRRLHLRRSGAPAWALLDHLLDRFAGRFTTCEEHLSVHAC